MAERKNGSDRAKPAVGVTLAQMEAKVEADGIAVAETVAEVALAAEAAAEPSETSTQIAEAALAAQPAQKGTSESMDQINEQFQQQAQAATDQVRSAFGDINERAKTAMERSARLAEEMTDLSRGNMEAMIAASKAAARGVETLAHESADYGRRSFEEASNALKSFAEARSATDFFKLQSDYARQAFEGYVAETAKMSEQVLKLAGEVTEPLTSRYAVAAERVKTLAA